MIYDLYDNYWQTALILNEGNIKDAEYFLDCGVYTYYERLKQKSDYNKAQNEAMKKMTDNSK